MVSRRTSQSAYGTTGGTTGGCERHQATKARHQTRELISTYLATLIDQHFNQLMTLLQQNGKDAHRAAQMAEALSAQLLNDTYETARIAEEARLRATARYTRRDLLDAHAPQ